MTRADGARAGTPRHQHALALAPCMLTVHGHGGARSGARLGLPEREQVLALLRGAERRVRPLAKATVGEAPACARRLPLASQAAGDSRRQGRRARLTPPRCSSRAARQHMM